MQIEIANTPKIRYKPKEKQNFYKVFHQRVNEYFKNNKLSKFGDWRIRAKVAFLYSVFVLSYFSIYLESNTPGTALLFACIFGLTGIIIAISLTHDASHNALFRNKKWNQLLLYMMNVLGSTGYLYSLNHVKIHHSFPNVIGIDADLNQGVPFLRVSPGNPKYSYHRYQHIYAPFIYSFYTLFLIFIKDFEDFRFIPKKDSPLLNVKHPRREYFIFFASKAFYITYALILPILLLDYAWWKIILAYLFVNVLMSIVAVGVQVLIHTNDEAHFIELEEDGSIDRDWAEHTVINTTDLLAENRTLTFWLGGLNTHTVHHLIPGICHIHYVDLTKILKKTAAEFGLVYTNFSLWQSIKSHYVFLKYLGRHSS